MNYFFLTGDSSGIGLALKQAILKDVNNFVFGLSRRASGNSKNYRSVKIDLSSKDELDRFDFPNLDEAERIVLINNAGQIGPIKPLFEQTSDQIEDVFQVNILAPTILISKLLQTYQDKEILIINISSGAAANPIQAWSTYCASKAALDMLTRTLIEDLEFRKKSNVKVYSVSPGVIDTKMQEEIRSSEEENFSMHSRFSNLKSNNELIAPEVTASLIYKIFSEPSFYDTSFISLRAFY